MLCERPFVQDGMAYGCGQCMPCRKNKHRIWSSRIMLESYQYKDNCVANLTYDDEHMPRLDDGRGILVRAELTAFLKRLRADVAPHRFRFFGCGEYGDKSMRPHFHVVLFDMPNCVYGKSRYLDYPYPKNCCPFCDRIRDKWGKGGIQLMELNMSTSQYVAQYVTKKMLHVDDPRLKGLPPEFPAMSLKPGIGAGMMHDYASTLLQFGLHLSRVDVPSTIAHNNGREMPIGRYLQQKLRVLVGRDKKAPQEVKDRIKQELSGLREKAFENSQSFAKEISKAGAQKRLNQENRAKIHKQRKDKL